MKPVSQMRHLRLREVRYPASGHPGIDPNSDLRHPTRGRSYQAALGNVHFFAMHFPKILMSQSFQQDPIKSSEVGTISKHDQCVMSSPCQLRRDKRGLTRTSFLN